MIKILILLFMSGCVVYLPSEEMESLIKEETCGKQLRICEMNVKALENFCQEKK